MPIINTVMPALAALAVVLGLVLLAGRAARWSGLGRAGLGRSLAGAGGRSRGRLAVQASLPLDRLRTLHIVRLDGRDLALLTGGPADLALGWLPDDASRVGDGA